MSRFQRLKPPAHGGASESKRRSLPAVARRIERGCFDADCRKPARVLLVGADGCAAFSDSSGWLTLSK
jgi:hypothetical protein